MNWTPIVNRIFDPNAFRDYVKSIQPEMQWKPVGIVLHNTSVPNLKQWAEADWSAHLRDLQDYYSQTMNWHAGPHLFVAPEGICVFTPLIVPGVHSPSWNLTHFGVEMVGEYMPGNDDWNSGKGQDVQDNAMSALATLCEVFGFDSHSPDFHFHKEDPKTTHSDCPGSQVVKNTVMSIVHEKLVIRQQQVQG